MDLKDKVIIVTGGASGIGEASAQVMARHGAKLLVGDVDTDNAERVAQGIADAGGEAICVAFDVTNPDHARDAVDKALSVYGRLDGAFNNAGIACPEALIHETDDAIMRTVIEIDVFGVWNSLKYQLKALKEAGQGGAIVINASDAGKGAVPMMSPYATAKAAAINLARNAAVEYGADNIRVNAICPGPVKTTNMAARLEEMGVDDSYYMTGMAIKRFGRPEEVGDLVTFLLSDRATFITGQAISIDGGFAASFT